MGSLPVVQPDLTPFATKLPKAGFEYVPPNWSAQKALYAITFQAQGSVQISSYNPLLGTDPNESSAILRVDNPSVAAGFNKTTQTNMFVFDAIKRALHRQYANITQHPLQTGFNISDHVMMQPKELVLEVGMSDAIASYTIAGYTPMWAGNPSKSVSAYQQMESLMVNRQLMTINTRLETYQNMVLKEISVEDSDRTYFGGLAMTLNFQQVFVADVSLSYLSARPQATDETQKGNVQPQPPTKAVVDQHKVPVIPLVTVPGTIPGAEPISAAANAAISIANIPGVGTYTSQILGAVQGLTP